MWRRPLAGPVGIGPGAGSSDVSEQIAGSHLKVYFAPIVRNVPTAPD